VRYDLAEEGEKGGALLPEDKDDKTGDTVLDVLQSKHPAARVPDTSIMEEYNTLPDFVEIDITEEVVEKVAHRLTGSAGPGRSDLSALQHWLLG
jgi:xanthine dehydrogenase molybdopterin-binding subunit B